MYAYDFKPEYNGIRHTEIFIVMPFPQEFDKVYENLIKPAIDGANRNLNLPSELLLKPYRTKDDMRTTSGWTNILEHLTAARIVLGVLTGNNPNVFYELGIAHATQPKTRQILIANRGYERKFDTKDLIYYEYDDKDLSSNIESLSNWVVDAYKNYKLEDEVKINRARMKLGPSEFMVINQFGQKRNFPFRFKDFNRDDYERKNGPGTYLFLIMGIRNLCNDGLLGLNTKSKVEEGGVNIEFSYYWTSIGNELQRRTIELPRYFAL